MESLFENDPRKEEYKTCLGDTIYSFKKEYKAELTPEEKDEVKGWKKDQRIKVGQRWMKIKKSGNPDGVIIPYIVKVSSQSYRKYAREPSDYSTAELGIICGIYDIESGLICTVYPNLDDMVNVFEVKFKSLKAIRKFVQSVIEGIEEIRESDELLSLPKCPKYMDDKGQCPLIGECTDCT